MASSPEQGFGELEAIPPGEHTLTLHPTGETEIVWPDGDSTPAMLPLGAAWFTFEPMRLDEAELYLIQVRGIVGQPIEATIEKTSWDEAGARGPL
jgi:hypothetical protein